jgi:hypothetical protein
MNMTNERNRPLGAKALKWSLKMCEMIATRTDRPEIGCAGANTV